MKPDEVQKFLNRLKGDSNLESRIRKLNRDSMVRMGADVGFDFSADDLRRAISESGVQEGELSEKELEGITGGGLGSFLKEWRWAL